MAQTKIAIDDEVNILLLGKGLIKSRATGEAKAVHAFKLGSPEDEKRSEDCFPFKVWKFLTPDAQVALRQS